MSDTTPRAGEIVWRDLTVPDAGAVRRFYESVVGWETSPHPMGDYDDYEVRVPGGDVVAGICHARGDNAALPPRWLLYVAVDDVDAAAARAVGMGGRILDGPRAMGPNRFCALEDPAGAAIARISRQPV